MYFVVRTMFLSGKYVRNQVGMFITMVENLLLMGPVIGRYASIYNSSLSGA